MEINTNNLNNSSFMSPLEKNGVIDSTKNFIRNALYEKLKNNNIPYVDSKLKVNPSNFNINDQNLYTMFKLEYTLIEDFLIRTKLDYTHSIFNNEIKSILKPLIPFDDGELIDLLGINLKELSSLRFKWNNSNDSSELIKSTYLYQILNSHTKIMKMETESQTNDLPVLDSALYSPDVRVEVQNGIDLQTRLKNIEDKYDKKLKEQTDILLVENRFKKYKDEIDKRYEEELKNEMEKFKTNELSQMRIEENKKYLMQTEKIRKEYDEEYKKKYEEFKKLQNDLEERELKLRKEYEERYNQLKKRYEEKEKNLDYKENYLEKKYKNDMDVMKFNEELSSLRESILNNERENKKKNINNKEINPLLNTEIDLMKKDIENIKNNMNNYFKQPYLKNNFIKQEEDKKNNYNINNAKPSKESVINSLNLLAKSNNNNINKSNNSQSGSGAYNKTQKKDRRKIMEELEEEQYKLNSQMREEFDKILHGDSPLLVMDKDKYDYFKNNNIYDDIFLNNYMSKDIYDDKKYNIEDTKTNNYVTDKNNNYNNNIDNNIHTTSKNDINIDKYNNIKEYNNFNHKNEVNKETNNNIKNNYNSKINSGSGLFNNNINNNSQRKSQSNSFINKSNNNINKNKETSPKNNIGGIGGFNIGGYNFGSTNNNIYNYSIKSENSGSVIEEHLEGDNNQNLKKENQIKKNIFLNSNKYQNENTIKEENEENASGVSNNNSIEDKKNNNNKNNINVNKSNKFNNYDYNDIYDVKNEEDIREDINYGESGDKDDLSGKKKMEMSDSISGIVKKPAEFLESVGGGGLGGFIQSHAGGFGNTDKESYGDFGLSEGKTNSKKGNDKGFAIQSKFNPQNQYSQRGNSDDIPEELSGF